jgi:general secretion pathway protein J
MSRARRRGFTLIELLVALAIFALISGFAYRGLNALLQSREALQKEARKWRDVSLFVGRFERDLGAVVVRPRLSKGASGSPQLTITSALDLSPATDGLAFTRGGSPLQENLLSAPQRIAYRLNGDRVERLAWAGADALPRETPSAVAVLAPVRSLGFRFLDPTDAQWRTSWTPAGDVLPAAVEVTAEMASGERIVRLVDLPRVQ